MSRRQPTSTLFPYTTLFRSVCDDEVGRPLVAQEERRPLSAHKFGRDLEDRDRKSTRLNSSHRCISYAVFCLKKKNKHQHTHYRRWRELPRRDEADPRQRGDG